MEIEVGLVNGWHGEIDGELALRLPEGWTSEPASHSFRFGQPGERARYAFAVSVPALEDRGYEIRAVATARGKEFSQGYDVIEHRDYETRYLYHPAVATVRGVDVEVVSGLRVGYVMGVGDQVPAGIEQLGAEVELLDEAALATGDLSRFDAIVTGTRAYAVREDLRTYNRRLLDYAREGGNLVVLYNTQEMVPNQHAPFPGELTRRAEEVSEEDSPMTILVPDHPVLTWPNRITLADFDGWVEQRGSKWWSTWDPAYTPLLETHDTAQDPQQGGWLYAPYGKGHYSYFAYAMHRQLPYGVPGAYRLFANVLALGKRRLRDPGEAARSTSSFRPNARGADHVQERDVPTRTSSGSPPARRSPAAWPRRSCGPPRPGATPQARGPQRPDPDRHHRDGRHGLRGHADRPGGPGGRARGGGGLLRRPPDPGQGGLRQGRDDHPGLPGDPRRARTSTR